MPSKTCQTCGYSSLNTEQCPLIGYKYQQNEKDICPHWTRELVVCGRCNKIIPIRNYCLTKFSDGTYKPICENCLKLSGACGGCLKSTTCDFETNPSPIPKAVQKRIQQSNQIMVVTVKNPDRIRETCQKNCECFSEEFGCLRENGTCGNYEGAF